ncbi:hypothetical protein BDN72DRAFT_537376 [Pluteus cervinus]|uniref:Uncharacterized protein n=1 Tax=Pluteus cervinus TaxID=181527 RepID=A0ACD3A4E4_9AGAR|nr:hypothetical protein BDN72DRAFT_537376 [Pluteus cervinus]
MAMPDLSDSANARHHDARAIPDLPPEIVYEILVMAYHEDPKSCTNLLLTAKYISEW